MALRTVSPRLWILATLVAGAVLGLVLTLIAPQIPLLLREGFPAAMWPAKGQFAVVRGDPTPLPNFGPPLAERSASAAKRFAETEGRAFIASQDGRIFAESYGAGVDRETRFNSYSLVKSLIGALAVKAVADGVIPGIDTRLADLVPGAPQDVTLRAALTMTSGLSLAGEPPKTEPGKPLDDHDYSPFSPMARLHGLGLDRTLPQIRIDPARANSFHYQSANTALIGAALVQAYGRPLPDLMSAMIWAPAGAADAQWRMYPGGDQVSAYCCLYARAIDWIRVGAFLLSNGPNGDFLPEALWREFVLPDLAAEERRAGVYGWHLRHDILDRPGAAIAGPFAYMMGHGGQVVYLWPEAQTVVVRFGGAPQRLHSTLYDLWPDGLP